MPTSPSALLAAILAALAIASPHVLAADNPELKQLRQEIDAMRRDYEARLKALEARLRQADAGLAVSTSSGGAPAVAAAAPAPPAAAALPAPAAETPGAAPTSPGAFNPAIALVLSASYASLSQPGPYRIEGFLTGGEVGAATQGFSLGESELTISGGVDPWFYGSMSLALTADNEAAVEEAYIQTTALPNGLTLRAGRFLSGIGYHNDKHAHTWDFVDSPLVYQAFLDGALHQDGLQLKVLLPTEQFIEIGSEIGAAGPFPSGGEARKKPGTAALFVHTGGDIGVSQSWRAGLSMLWADAQGRESNAIDSVGNEVTNAFSGTGRLGIIDAVWKWAPNGNAQRTSLTLQGEYVRRFESGTLVYDSANAALADGYRSTQSGWYAQAVYKFMPAWRVGLRYDRLDIGNVDAYSNTANLFLPDRAPTRATAMLDWSPSEFSRIRLQWAQDKARYGLTDNQFLIQYQMSLGSHGAHSF
jgi:hypothetical protein